MFTPKISLDMWRDDLDLGSNFMDVYNEARKQIMHQQEQRFVEWLDAKNVVDAMRILKALNDYGLTVVMESEPIELIVADDPDKFTFELTQNIAFKLEAIKENS